MEWFSGLSMSSAGGTLSMLLPNYQGFAILALYTLCMVATVLAGKKKAIKVISGLVITCGFLYAYISVSGHHSQGASMMPNIKQIGTPPATPPGLAFWIGLIVFVALVVLTGKSD